MSRTRKRHKKWNDDYIEYEETFSKKSKIDRRQEKKNKNSNKFKHLNYEPNDEMENY